uniref:Uncharacterized protein n=1 Tax=Triticum urartu TaxID=4572 RepID=A0A8R7U4F3_TRIUA
MAETGPTHRLRARAEAAVASLVDVRPHEMAPLTSAASTFFFILSAYFVVLPLRDEGAISLGLGALPGLFAGSLVLTVLAAPVASLAFSLPSVPKSRVRAFLTWVVSVCLCLNGNNSTTADKSNANNARIQQNKDCTSLNTTPPVFF